MHKTILGCVVLGSLLAAGANAADAKKIISDVRDAQIDRWEGIALYQTTIETMGMSVNSYFQRFSLQQADGSVVPSFHQVGEADFRCGAVPTEPMSEAEIMAWLASRGDSTIGMGDGEMSADADVGAMPMLSQLMDSATLAGEENVSGNEAWHLIASDIDMSDSTDAPELDIDDYELWIDKRSLQILRVRMVGQLTEDGETRDVDMKINFSDFRDVAGSRMNMPFAQKVSMSGAMSPDEQAELDEAMQALAEMEEELAAMPASQRAMVEKMMGDQLQMMRDMVDGGGITFESAVSGVEVNIDAEGETCSL